MLLFVSSSFTRMQGVRQLTKGTPLITQVLVAPVLELCRAHPGVCGLQEGCGTTPASQSLISALIHLMNYTWKQLHTEGGAGRGEGDLAYN